MQTQDRNRPVEQPQLVPREVSERELGSRDFGRLSEVERIVDRIRYAGSRESEQVELQSLYGLFYPDSGKIRKLYD